MAEGHETRAAARRARAMAQPQRTSPPSDRFDDVARSGRVGAHRVIGKPRRFWIYLVSALVATALLTGAGVIALQVTGANLQNMGGSDTPTEPAKELGGVSTFQSSDYDEYGARLIVLLGADYAGPGSDQLVVPEPAAQ